MPTPLEMLEEQQEDQPRSLIRYSKDAPKSALGMIPTPTGPRAPNFVDVMKTRGGSALQMMGTSEPPPETPQEANVVAEARIKILDPGADDGDWLLADEREKAKKIRSYFGDKVARFLYGSEVIDSLPGRRVPNDYKYAYRQGDKWFIPGKGEVEPPPESFMEGQPEKSFAEKSIEWVLPEGMIHWEERLHDIVRGGAYERHEAINDLGYAALELLALKRLPGAKVLGKETVADVMLAATGKSIKKILKTGIAPPRLMMKALAHIDGKLFLPMREKAWEVISWPLTKPRIIPSYGEGGKTVAEIFQPAVERLAKKGADKPFREGQAQRQLVAQIGERLGKQVQYLSPAERVQFGKALRGEKVTSDKIRDMVRGLRKKTHLLNLEKRYEEHFYDELGKNAKRLDFGWGLEGEMPMLQASAASLGVNLAERGGIKAIQKSLKELIENPLTPKSAKALAHDLYNMPAATPEAVASAARYAMRHSIADRLKSSPYVKTALGVGDNTKDWMLSDHPLMKGLWVDRDTELELRALEEIPKMAQRTFNKWFMTPWKTSKVILRSATHFRNMISNTILNDWGGLPFYRLDVYHDALKQVRNKSKLWKEFQRLTGAGGTFSSEEINQLSAGLKYGSNMFDSALAMFDKFASPFRSLYNAEEQVFKFAKHIHNLEKGMEPVEAAWDAVKWTFNYGEVTRATALVRGYLAPFYTWQSKVIPLMAESIVKHPWRVGKWALMYQGLQSHALSNLHISDDEWQRFEQILPEYIQEGQMLLLPWRDQEGRLQMLNLTYMIPGFGDWSEIAAHPAGELIGHPLTILAGELRTKTKWSGAPLYYDWEDGSTKAMKVFSHVWDAMVPSWAPGAMDWDKVGDMIHNVEGSPTIEQMLASQVGFKIIPIDEMRARRSRQVIDNIHRAEIASEMKRELRRAGSDPKRRAKVVERFQHLRRQIGTFE